MTPTFTISPTSTRITFDCVLVAAIALPALRVSITSAPALKILSVVSVLVSPWPRQPPLLFPCRQRHLADYNLAFACALGSAIALQTDPSITSVRALALTCEVGGGLAIAAISPAPIAAVNFHSQCFCLRAIGLLPAFHIFSLPALGGFRCIHPAPGSVVFALAPLLLPHPSFMPACIVGIAFTAFTPVPIALSTLSAVAASSTPAPALNAFACGPDAAMVLLPAFSIWSLGFAFAANFAAFRLDPFSHPFFNNVLVPQHAAPIERCFSTRV
jgi:hypothetical protein